MSAQVWLFDAYHWYQRTALMLLVLVQMTERVRKHVIELVLSTDMKQVREGLRGGREKGEDCMAVSVGQTTRWMVG